MKKRLKTEEEESFDRPMTYISWRWCQADLFRIMSGLSQCCLVKKKNRKHDFSTVQNFGAHTFCKLGIVLVSVLQEG